MSERVYQRPIIGAPGARPFQPQTRESQLEAYNEIIQERKDLRERSFPFISPAFHPDTRLHSGLVVVGAVTGQAKSTTNANVIASFIKEQDQKRAVVISNEESMDAVYNRIACVLLKLDYNRYHRGQMSASDGNRVEEKARSLMDRVEVITNINGWDMTYLEDVQAVMEWASRDPDVGLIAIDYLQTIAFSRESRMLSQYDVSKRFGNYLVSHGKKKGAPVVLFVQLKNKVGDNTFFKSRVEGDSHTINHAELVVEILPDFNQSTTKFVIQKSRWGIPQGTEVHATFVAGRYEFKEDSDANEEATLSIV
jgi:hypothetical protein